MTSKYFAFHGHYHVLIVYFTVWNIIEFISNRGWSGGAMVLGKLPVPGRPTILI